MNKCFSQKEFNMKKGLGLVSFLIVAMFSLPIFALASDYDASSPNQIAKNEITPISGNGAGKDMLQFKSGSHILGFMPNKAYLAAPDHALIVEFIGAKEVKPISDTKGATKGSATKAPPLSKVVYRNLWEGISLTYESTTDGATESTYHVAPGANVSKIRLKYNVPVEAQKDGSLKFKFEKGFLTESAPVAWQEIDGKRVAVKVAFKVDKGEVGFSVGKYDSSQQLIVDPTYAWHTFYGGCDDTGKSIAVDKSGNIYITGSSDLSWNGSGNQPPLNSHSGVGKYNIYVLKLDSSGTYLWHTFYGSSSGYSPNYGNVLAVDVRGNVYVAGYSGGETWNGPGNQPPLSPHSVGGGDIIALKLDNNGAYQWHTFVGSETSNNWINGIAVATDGNVYITGNSNGPWGSPKHSHSGGQEDIIILRLDAGGAYQWHTYYGSSGSDSSGTGIAIVGNGNVYVTGYSPVTWNGPDDQLPLNPHSGGYDVAVLKLDGDGTYQWHTFYGSGDWDVAHAIAVDASGGLYVTGESWATWGSPINPYIGSIDIFVLKLDGNGVYQWNTFYGSTAEDVGQSIVVDGSRNIYVSGKSFSSWGSPLNELTGNFDSFILKLNNVGIYQWNTFYGAYPADYGNAIAMDDGGNVYVAGESKASWGYPLHDYGCGLMQYTNPFVLRLAPTTCPDHAVMIGESTSYYTTIHDAYTANAIDKSILMQALEFNEDVDLDSNISVALRGGYECDFLSNPGRATIHGSLTVSSGTATIENVVIR